jgi:hypothetical protein
MCNVPKDEVDARAATKERALKARESKMLTEIRLDIKTTNHKHVWLLMVMCVVDDDTVCCGDLWVGSKVGQQAELLRHLDPRSCLGLRQCHARAIVLLLLYPTVIDTDFIL